MVEARKDSKSVSKSHDCPRASECGHKPAARYRAHGTAERALIRKIKSAARVNCETPWTIESRCSTLAIERSCRCTTTKSCDNSRTAHDSYAIIFNICHVKCPTPVANTRGAVELSHCARGIEKTSRSRSRKQCYGTLGGEFVDYIHACVHKKKERPVCGYTRDTDGPSQNRIRNHKHGGVGKNCHNRGGETVARRCVHNTFKIQGILRPVDRVSSSGSTCCCSSEAVACKRTHGA